MGALEDLGDAYSRHADELIRFATGVVGPSDATEVVSSAIMRVAASRAWASASDTKAYLFRAVLNEARMSYRSDLRRRTRELRAASREIVPAAEVRPEVLAAVSQLSVRQRAVVVLTYWGDLDAAATGELIGCSEGSVRRHLARARARLRELLDD